MELAALGVQRDLVTMNQKCRPRLLSQLLFMILLMLLDCDCAVAWSGENRVLAAKAGAIDALVAVLRAHVGGDAGVLKQACDAIGWICEGNGAWNWRPLTMRL